MDKRKFVKNLNEETPEITTFKQKDYDIKLVWKDRQNTEYEIIEEELIHIGKTKSYKDHIAQGLSPIIENNKLVYGKARTLEPKTKTINDMKSHIDDATNKYYELAKQELIKQETQQQASTIPTEGGATND